MSMDGMAVEIGGILTEVKGKATRKGAYMGFITIEDLTGQIECLVFPKVYERYQAMMSVDDLVVLTGKLSIREEEAPKLLVDTLIPLDMWEERPKTTVPSEQEHRSAASIPAEKPPVRPHRAPAQPRLTDAQRAANAPRKLFIQLDRARMEEATHMLSLHPGSIPVYLHIPAEKMTLLMPSLQWCDGSDACLRRLRDGFGTENVKIVEKKDS